VTVTRYPQTMTWLTPATNAVVLIGQSVPLEASASSGLPVTYSVVSGPATLDQGSVVVDGAGTIVLQADQAGSDRYEPASARLVLNPIGVAELAGGGVWLGDRRGAALGVHVVGTRAYVAQGDGGLAIYEVSDPMMPVRLGGYATPGAANGVFVAGTLAFVAEGTVGLEVIDVSDPAAPGAPGGATIRRGAPMRCR
jgi:hypothetical protein